MTSPDDVLLFGIINDPAITIKVWVFVFFLNTSYIWSACTAYVVFHSIFSTVNDRDIDVYHFIWPTLSYTYTFTLT